MMTLLQHLAGDESHGWSTLIDHLILITTKLEGQGYLYDEVTRSINDSTEY
jgi:hypothetical protein